MSENVLDRVKAKNEAEKVCRRAFVVALEEWAKAGDRLVVAQRAYWKAMKETVALEAEIAYKVVDKLDEDAAPLVSTDGETVNTEAP